MGTVIRAEAWAVPHGSLLPALKRGQLHMGSELQIGDLDAFAWKTRLGLLYYCLITICERLESNVVSL